ncbi:MAG: hypothetical protein ACOYJG_04915 [Prevotella sp.]|jgi:hypothetical protein
MRIIRNRFLPCKNFLAINLFGLCFCREDAVITKRVVNHESIHTAQMRELLYVGFYLFYILEWLCRLIACRSSYQAYMAISFEREAYAHDEDFSYLKRRKHYAWTKYLH